MKVPLLDRLTKRKTKGEEAAEKAAQAFLDEINAVQARHGHKLVSVLSISDAGILPAWKVIKAEPQPTDGKPAAN